MELALIVAHDPNLLIGKKGGLPWRIPEDLAYFKRVTMGCPIIMGRIVFEEIGEKPLPGRRNIVLSRTKTWVTKDVESYRSLDEALEAVKTEEKVFIIGGRALYEKGLEIADTLYITLIDSEYEGDTWFPEYRNQIGLIWEETERKSENRLTFIVYKRIR
jgi:dihydrofolate reductase